MSNITFTLPFLFSIVNYSLFDYTKINTIIFPEYIKKVAISFVQGMFTEILKVIDKNEIEKHVIIKSSSEQLTNKIISNIKF